MKMEYANTCSSISHWDTCKIKTKLPPVGTKYVLYNLVTKRISLNDNIKGDF